MRSYVGICILLTAVTLAWTGENSLFAQQSGIQPPAVSTSVPNIQAPGAAAVTNPSSVISQGTAPMQAGTTGATTYSGNSAAVQPGATTTVPSNGMTYYYPAQNGGPMLQRTAPGTYYYYTNASAPVYNAPAQTYYAPVRRGFPFGLFRRRYATTYTTAATTATPTYYYTSPGYYYTPTTYYTPATAPVGTNTSGVTPGTTAPVYTPTQYTVPTDNLPAGSTAPLTTTPSGAATPTRSIPAPPPVINPK